MGEFLYGKNPIVEAVRANRRKFQQIYVATGTKADPSLREVMAWAQTQDLKVREVPRSWFEGRFPDTTHQGWAAEVSPYPYAPFADLQQGTAGLKLATLLALDQIQDPQNLGSILRTAEACGVNGVLIPERHSSPVTPAVAKASAGAVEHLKVCHVTNLSQALEKLKEIGFWTVGTTLQTAEDALNFAWPEKTVLILGSEGRGMRVLTEKTCDFLIHLPLTGKIQSLNVAAAAAVFLYGRIKGKK